jgi:probable phosphoglycerate mutase
MIQTTVVLARHGRTSWHADNRYLGHTDLPLDSYGECQAAALAAWASGQGFTSLVCSSMARARATMVPVAALTGLAPRFDERLRELDFGIAEGLTLAELRAMDPVMVERFLSDPVAYHFPSGEDPGDAADRATAAIADAVAADAGGRLLVVAHSTLIRLLTCAALGLPLLDYRRGLPQLDPGATVTLRFCEGRETELIAFNVPVPTDCKDVPAGSAATGSARGVAVDTSGD